MCQTSHFGPSTYEYGTDGGEVHDPKEMEQQRDESEICHSWNNRWIGHDPDRSILWQQLDRQWNRLDDGDYVVQRCYHRSADGDNRIGLIHKRVSNRAVSVVTDGRYGRTYRLCHRRRSYDIDLSGPSPTRPHDAVVAGSVPATADSHPYATRTVSVA